jgi:predicted deacylase
VEIFPDPVLKESHFMTHYPSYIWYSVRQLARWAPLQNTWPSSVTFHEKHIELSIPVHPGMEMFVASHYPLRYSDLMKWHEKVEGDGVALEKGFIGRSYEGREIPYCRIRAGKGSRPKVLVFAGQHSSEHGGIVASQGIVDYLCSGMAEARELARRLDVVVIPMINPDGNVHGFTGTNAQRLPVNMSVSFGGAAEGKKLEVHESQLLWTWIVKKFHPDYLLHFHSYSGWRYAFEHPEKVFKNASKVRLYRRIYRRLYFETAGYTAHWPETGKISESMLEAQLARKYGTLSILYEVNSSTVGPSRQTRRGPEIFTSLARSVLQDGGA